MHCEPDAELLAIPAASVGPRRKALYAEYTDHVQADCERGRFARSASCVANRLEGIRKRTSMALATCTASRVQVWVGKDSLARSSTAIRASKLEPFEQLERRGKHCRGPPRTDHHDLVLGPRLRHRELILARLARRLAPARTTYGRGCRTRRCLPAVG